MRLSNKIEKRRKLEKSTENVSFNGLLAVYATDVHRVDYVGVYTRENGRARLGLNFFYFYL